MESKLVIEKVTQHSGVVRLTLCGSVNVFSSSQLLAALTPLFAAPVQSISVDLSRVDVVDSSGIATLVEGLRWSRQSGGTFLLTGMTDRVRDAFGLAKLEKEFTIV